MENTNTEKVFCHECGCECKPDGIFAGYGTDKDGNKFCYECCGKHDKQELENMKIGEKTIQYLHKDDENKWWVVNFPSSLKLRIWMVHEGRHNIAGIRRDVWFDFNGNNFHGVQYGNFSELCYIRRVK